MLVIQQCGKVLSRRRAFRFFSHFVGDPDRGKTHHIAGLNPGLCTHAPLVDPYFTTTDDAVDMGLGHPLEVAHEKVVESLSGGVFIDLDQPYRGRGRILGPVLCRFALYNVFHLCRA
ncbi:hypothetical protein CTATCC11996_13220 [Comamonas testosteroni ATCC 11996]|nr:hypothetical protein CTATCC11996_13220 [Comamonas testosteroni ATCC 11996]